MIDGNPHCTGLHTEVVFQRKGSSTRLAVCRRGASGTGRGANDAALGSSIRVGAARTGRVTGAQVEQHVGDTGEAVSKVLAGWAVWVAGRTDKPQGKGAAGTVGIADAVVEELARGARGAG